MQISISNAIESLRRGGARIIQFGLQLWLDFNKSEIIGSDLVVNGDFATDSDWSLGTGWSIGNNKMVCNGSQTSYTNSEQIGALESNRRYKMTVTVTLSTGVLSVGSSGNFLSITQVGENVIYNYIFTNTVDDDITISGNIDFTGSVTNISVKEVTQFVMDKSPNTNNAKLFTGKALSFDGVNDYVDLGSQATEGSELTVVTWLKLNDLVGNQSILSYGDFLVRTDDTDIMCFGDVAVSFARFSDVLTTNNIRLVVTISGTSASLYLNGTLIDTKSISALSSDSSASYIGKYTSIWFLGGLLADLQYYNKAWTASDVAFDYNNPNHLAIDNPDTDLIVTDLKAYWALSEGDGLVAYDSGSTLEEDVVQNGDFSELGVEEVTNGDFATDLSGWTLDTSRGSYAWDVGRIKITNDAANSYANCSQDIATTIGGIYRVRGTVEIGTATTIEFRATRVGGNATQQLSSDGTIDFTFIADQASTKLLCYLWSPTGNTDDYCYFDNISVKQVDPNDEWTLGTGWSYGNDKVISDGTATAVQQNGLLTIDSTYQITATVTGNPSLLVFNSSVFYNDLASRTLSNGTNTYILKAKAINFAITNAGGDSCDVTNISVTEITPSDHGGIINGATYVLAQDTIPQLGMMDWAKGSNLYLSSEPTANESAAGDISYGSYSWGLNGFSNATIFGDNSVLRYRYGGSTTIGVEYTLSAFVIMDDNSEPDVTNLSSSGDFSLVVSGSVGVGVISKTNISGNIWRVSKVKTAVASTTSNGIVKYTTQSAKGFKVVGWQIEESSSVGNYILTDGAAAIDVTTIQNPTNKGYDIFGNPLRLREHAFNLDGSGYAEVADDDSLDMNEGFSVSFWRKLDVSTDGVRSAILTKGVGLSTGVDFGFALSMFSNKLNADINTSAGRFLNQTTLTIDGRWVFVTFTYTKNDKSRVYIDTDAPIVSTTISGTINETHPIRIGTDKDLGFKDSSLIDEVVWYDRPLTQKEITQNYNVGLPAHTNPSSYSGDYSSDYGF